MPQLQTSEAVPEGPFTADPRGVHYDFIKERIPAWFSQASTYRLQELGSHPLRLPAWYRRASPAQKETLAQAHTALRESLNTVEQTLGSINDVLTFAEQPLKNAIKARFGLDLDVRAVFFARKFGFKSRSDLFGAFIFDQTRDSDVNYVYHGVSLLEAALANFEPDEAKPARCDDCQIITRWSRYDGEVIATFDAINSQAVAIAAHAFAGLCRELDLGTLYQQHIKALLQPEDSQQRETLERQVENHHRRQLALSCEIARLQGVASLSADALRVLDQVQTDQSLIFSASRPVTYAGLSLFGIELTGPLLIGPARKGSDRVERLTVYLPNDPEQPLKEYASSGAFMSDLRKRLHGAAFRRFFSRFVPVRAQGLFFRKFDALYKPAQLGRDADYPFKPSLSRLPLDERAWGGWLGPNHP